MSRGELILAPLLFFRTTGAEKADTQVRKEKARKKQTPKLAPPKLAPKLAGRHRGSRTTGKISKEDGCANAEVRLIRNKTALGGNNLRCADPVSERGLGYAMQSKAMGNGKLQQERRETQCTI